MRVLVLGGYGLIGLEISKALLVAGHAVTGLGRSAARGRALLPQAEWREADISRLLSAGDWAPFLDGIDAIINASGALQDGARENLAAVQQEAIIALIDAAARQGIGKFVQISAPGAMEGATTGFLRTKAAADAALKASSLDYVILRPGLVLAPTAFGGTSLLRALAAMPLVQPLVLANTPIQTVSAADVAAAACRALESALPQRDYDLVEAGPRPLKEVVAQMRAWLGFAPARAVLPIPFWAGRVLARGADIAGWLGWRPALRTTSLRVLQLGVTGDGAPWAAATGAPLSPLEESLRALPATAQERRYARTQLCLPVLILIYSAFWMLSGVIGLVQLDAAAEVLPPYVPQGAARAMVIAGGAADIAIGLGVLIRPWFTKALVAGLALSLLYMGAGTLLTPGLWADPLGPFVKILPGLGLALALLALSEER